MAEACIFLVEAGIHLFMALYGLSVFLESAKERRRGRTRYIVATVAKYARTWERYLSITVLTVAIIVGDALLVYRCYVIWVGYWWASLLPSLTYLASVAMGIVCLFPSKNRTANGHREAAWIFLTVSTNIMVTALISFRLLSAHRSFSKSIPNRNLKLYTGAVAILIESALPLSVLGLVYSAIVIAKPQRSTSAYNSYRIALLTFSSLFYAASSLAPHAIIFRITTGRSWTKSPVGTNGALTNPIEFARSIAEESSFMESSSGNGITTVNRVEDKDSKA
ncbi:hypothetical protein EST38_g14147 [Candolleomyces aberdarensis]|uniref:Uncharacterized protein n=1 Tax=Candolleomyces aberdarensis TaxID=2316362 RepID=A0A4V1Q1I5_9AGAR|nr:hypothetical protein EST38_g14147 [Candolleomyces aberdarensis]